MICSESTLDSETLCKYSFPLSIAQTVIANKITEFKIKQVSVQKCPVYFCLPWLSGINESFVK